MNLLREPIVLMLAAGAVGWGVYAGSGPPGALPAASPANEFSAARASAILGQLYADAGPHVSGSAANATLRDDILAVLEAAGYQPEIQRRFHCNPAFASCSPVENIIAVQPGSHEPRQAILLTAHYDSGWAGPGVADDGAGVAAVLEIARMVARATAFRNDIIFLLADGEEQGLIGAHAFASLHPLFERVRAVINLEARGVTGPSAMFETADGNRGMIRLLAKNLERPVANSLTYELYRRMPNDTDFSVYRLHPLTGVNFAFSEGVAAYHSGIDDLAHLDRASLQHHGQNAWSVLRALDQRTLDRMVSSENAVYVDLFGRSLLHFPESTAAGLALVISVLVLIAIRRSYARQFMFRQLFWSLTAVTGLALALPAAGWLISWPLGRWPDLPPLEHPYPWGGRVVLLLLAVWLLQRAVTWLAPRASTGSVMLACWGLYAVLALALATAFPAASFVPLLPLLAFMLGLALDGLRWRRRPRLAFSGLFGFLAAFYIGLYLSRMLETVLNFDQAALLMLPLLLPATAALPLLVWHVDRHGAARRFGVAAAILILLGCAAQWFIPAYTADRPRDLAVYYLKEASRAEAWTVLESVFGTVDADYAERYAFRPVDLSGPDGQPRRYLALASASLELPDLEARGRRVGDGTRSAGSERFLLDLGLPAGLRQLVITLPGETELLHATVGGQLLFDAALPRFQPRASRRLLLNHPDPGALRLELEIGFGASRERALQIDVRFDLPDARLEPFRADWPEAAQPAFQGPRAVVRYRVPLSDEPAGREGL
jgi:hypothetical protein